ncbi:TetR/AcrR family transcriptional regulator [Aureibaculum sp. 2210JD6-5]|uniref:TetR/AcrR family transcriptional regulator n=1 Tax=Aureibaculum sp. 2210JD6-5 TaxID=3103957 RepID=UPI002AAEB63D|nr:TetR/AcrR family transcriptional regulator [Aureibaculum sp. 2210JD6-5]MDY7396972.1 TetR/AcrR family transcriptional regulator [Aureibaculum sp. 2210JD6-5]
MITKQRIISQAIESYNAFGVTNVTSRDIAKLLNISHGNLDYHFPNKEALLLAIYKKMKKDASKIYDEEHILQDPFTNFNKLLLGLETFQKKYQFFNLDILEISRKYEKVSILLNKTFQIRRSQMGVFYKAFMDLGYLKEETTPGMYVHLQHTVRILITFWCSQKEILSYNEDIQKTSMSTYIWELLLPHMTKKGLNAYQELPLINV